MDLCSLEDAFPNIDTGSVHRSLTEVSSSGFPFVGGIDSKPSREERRAARKRAKKVKGPALAYSDSIAGDIPPTDPDRPAVKRMEPVSSTQEEKDGFVCSSNDTESCLFSKAKTIPVLPKASCLFSDSGTPSYFGKDIDDTGEEGFSSFSAVGNDNPNYMLQPDFNTTFDLKGVGKAGGELPEPNINDTWKPMSNGASYTAFVADTDRAEGGWSMNAEQRGGRLSYKGNIPVNTPALINAERRDTGEKDALMGRINELVARLENLEKKKVQDSQTEILMFVGTGVFLLISFELFTRR